MTHAHDTNQFGDQSNVYFCICVFAKYNCIPLQLFKWRPRQWDQSYVDTVRQRQYMGPTVRRAAKKVADTHTHIHTWLGYVMKRRYGEWNHQFSFAIRHKMIDICSVSE